MPGPPGGRGGKGCPKGPLRSSDLLHRPYVWAELASALGPLGQGKGSPHPRLLAEKGSLQPATELLRGSGDPRGPGAPRSRSCRCLAGTSRGMGLGPGKQPLLGGHPTRQSERFSVASGHDQELRSRDETIPITLGMDEGNLAGDGILRAQDAAEHLDFLSMQATPLSSELSSGPLDALWPPFLAILTQWLGGKEVMCLGLGIPTEPVPRQERMQEKPGAEPRLRGGGCPLLFVCSGTPAAGGHDGGHDLVLLRF